MRRRLLIPTLCLLPVALRGQAVRGTVVDGQGRPVAGVVVVMVDTAVNVTARALTNEQGEFRVAAGKAGTYRIRSTRIGFRALISSPFTLNAGETASQRLVLADIPFVLDTIHSQGKNVCGKAAGDVAAATWAIWDQARAALTAGDVTAMEQGVSATVIRYSRTLELTHRRIVKQAGIARTEVIGQAWRSISPDSLRRVGYVSGGDSLAFTAPGLDVLASDEFVEDHCFHLSVADSEVVGVAFEPTRERKGVPEVRGTAWLDRKSSGLRRIEFAYVNVSRDVDGEAGGEMEFVQLRNGAWAISRWSIRMPVFALFDGLHGFETRLVEYHVAGGELVTATSVASQGRDTLWARSPLTLAGKVVDSLSGAPLREARVFLRGTTADGITSDDGKFSIANVMPGSYTVEIATPSLDSMSAVKEAPLVFTDSMPPLVLRVPTGGQMAARLCGSRLAAAGIVLGTVSTRGDTTPSANVAVTALWAEASTTGGKVDHPPQVSNARTNGKGSFVMCGLPINAAMTLKAENATGSATPVVVRIPAGQRVGRAGLILDVGRVAAAGFVGVVLNDSTNAPIANAEVSLPVIAKQVVTNEKGEFQISDIAPGQQRVRVRRLGYGVLDTVLEFEPDRVLRKTVYLGRVTTLDSVLVQGAMRDPAMDDFNENRRLGLGHFFTRDDIAKFDVGHLADVLAQAPGTRFIKGRSGQSWLAGSRKRIGGDSLSTSDRSNNASAGCYAQVYLDNMLMYASKRTGGLPDPLFDINSIPPSTVEAIEYYAGPSEIPAKYMHLNSECGVLVIHTRR